MHSSSQLFAYPLDNDWTFGLLLNFSHDNVKIKTNFIPRTFIYKELIIIRTYWIAQGTLLNTL